MSSSSILITIQTQLNLYTYSIFMILGIGGNIFIDILNQQRQNACATYLLSSSVVNILYLNVTIRILSKLTWIELVHFISPMYLAMTLS